MRAAADFPAPIPPVIPITGRFWVKGKTTLEGITPSGIHMAYMEAIHALNSVNRSNKTGKIPLYGQRSNES